MPALPHAPNRPVFRLEAARPSKCAAHRLRVGLSVNLSEERLMHFANKLRLPDVPSLVPALAQEAADKEWSFSDFA